MLDRRHRGDALTIFPGQYLPWRGAADDRLLPVAIDLVMSVEESVFGELREDEPELIDSFAAVPGDEGWVAEWFADRAGRRIAFGQYPPFLSDDPAVALDAYIPEPDGSVVLGAY